MPWLTRDPYLPVHECDLPKPRRKQKIKIGAKWQCPVDGIIWEYTGDMNGLWRRWVSNGAVFDGPLPALPKLPELPSLQAAARWHGRGKRS